MNHRFNSTGRVRITRDLFEIRLHDDVDSGVPRFFARLDGLLTLGLDPEARVVVEPYVKSSSMRFDYGALGAMTPPASTSLDDIDRGATVQFRIKVVDTKEKTGRLLAMADQVRPLDQDEDDNPSSILPVKLTDLGEAIWEIQVSINDSPLLLLNRRVADISARLIDDPVLQGAIYPSAVRSIYTVILTAETLDRNLPWVKDWREFAHALIGEPLPDDVEEDEDLDEIVRRLVDAFAERSRWATAAQPLPSEELEYD